MSIMTNRLENILDFRIVFALYATKVDFLRLECSRLPWIGAAGATPGLPLQSIVQTHFLPLLNGEKPQLKVMSDAITLAASKLGEHLKTEFAIFCDVRLHFVFEEQASQAMGKLAERLGIDDGDAVIGKLTAAAPLGKVTFTNVEEISKVRAEAITEANFTIPDPEIEVYPGREISFVLTSKEPVICREFQLFCREHQVLRHRMPVHFDATSRRTIRLPGIPVAMYRHLLWKQSRDLHLRLVLEGRKQPLTLNQKLVHQQIVLTRAPAAVFLDVGSAFSKFLVIELAIDPTDTPAEPSRLAEKLRLRLEEASNGSDSGVFLEGPQPSQAFVETYGLSHTPKEKLDSYDDVELAAHFARSLSGLADRFYRSEGRLVSEVFWAFPNTKGRDFEAITNKVNELVGGTLLGEARIVPESECLRSAFSGSLHELAQAAKAVVEQKETAEEENRKAARAAHRIQMAWDAYQQSPWYEKAVVWVSGNKPKDSSRQMSERVRIPTLEEWHREFSKLECDENLSDFLVFDAGGYSLDVFATFSDASDEELSLSVSAGSTVINNALVEELRKTAPERSEADHLQKAERLKRQICSEPERFEQHDLYNLCRETTIQNYGSHIDTVLDRVHERIKGKGFPIILTGGGGRNQFLQQLLKEKLKARGLVTVLINSPLLYGTLRTTRSDSPELKLFLCMASAFHPNEEIPRMAPFTDILGGLAQLALKL